MAQKGIFCYIEDFLVQKKTFCYSKRLSVKEKDFLLDKDFLLQNSTCWYPQACKEHNTTFFCGMAPYGTEQDLFNRPGGAVAVLPTAL